MATVSDIIKKIDNRTAVTGKRPSAIMQDVFNYIELLRDFYKNYWNRSPAFGGNDPQKLASFKIGDCSVIAVDACCSVLTSNEDILRAYSERLMWPEVDISTSSPAVYLEIGQLRFPLLRPLSSFRADREPAAAKTPPKPITKACSCSMTQLMAYGCNCKGT